MTEQFAQALVEACMTMNLAIQSIDTAARYANRPPVSGIYADAIRELRERAAIAERDLSRLAIYAKRDTASMTTPTTRSNAT